MSVVRHWAFSSTKTLVCELGGASRLAEHLTALGVRRPLVATDAGVAGAGLLDGALASLKGAGMDVAVYSETTADPSEQLVLDATDRARAHAADSVVGFGGGSSMDIAKLVAVLAEPTAAQPLAEMYGVGNVRGARLPLVQVPTTALEDVCASGQQVQLVKVDTEGAVSLHLPSSVPSSPFASLHLPSSPFVSLRLPSSQGGHRGRRGARAECIAAQAGMHP